MKNIKLAVLLGVSLVLPVLVMAGDAMVLNVEAVHKQSASLAGKQVQVSGKVVKVNNGIMKRNFLHIQDGSGGQGTNDLTITSAETASVGEEVTVTGTVVLNTDFGFGYSYPLLVENAKISRK